MGQEPTLPDELSFEELERERVELLPDRDEMSFINVNGNKVFHVSGQSSLISTGDVLSGNTL
jgi:hypothetical protein